MKRRLISLLAVVAMLVSMLTCIIIPASADDSITEPYAALLEDVPGATSLAAVIDGATDANVLVNALQEDVTAGRITWPVWAYGSEDYPCYEYHAVYEAAGYDGKNWSISSPDDWAVMDAFANAAAAGDYFSGVTFHLTKDINFNDELMYPLGIQTAKKMTFAGTIDGHGFGFENININSSSNPLDNTYFMTGDDTIKESIGLIGFLGNNSTIQNFGVNSGIIYGHTGNAGVSTSTFGTVAANATANFNKVWSGVKLQGASNPFISPLAGLDTNNTTCKVAVNGFTFYGETAKGGSKYQYIYGIMGGVSVAPAAGSSFANILTYPTVPADKYTYLFGGGLSNLNDYTISNVYGIKKAGTNAAGVGVEYDYRTGTSNAGYGGAGTSLLTTETPLGAAYDLNTKQTGAADPVYFTMVGEKIRPAATAAGAIAKLAVTVGETTVAEYIKSGDTVTKAQILEMAGLKSAEVKSILVNGDELTADSFTAGITNNVVIDPSAVGQLKEMANKYASLDAKYLTDASTTALEKFVADASAITDDAAAIEFMKTEAALIASLDTYHAYPFAEGKEIPAYSLKETYGAFNHTQNWVIKTKEDWAAMRDVADKATEDYFKGATFHLVDDVDFTINEALAPMGINTNGAGFAGTLDGHGFGFNDIYVYKNDIFGDKDTGDRDVKHTGLFLRLADCTIKDFGLNGGLIYQNSSNSSGAISSFGTVLTGKVPTFERVWSSAYIAPYCSARANGLVATISNAPITVNVNGFVFDGTLAKGYGDGHGNQLSYGVFHTGNDNNNPGAFYNIITDFESYNAKVVVSNGAYTITEKDIGVKSALFGFSSEEVYKSTTIKNVYAVKGGEKGIDDGYAISNVLGGNDAASLLTDLSAAEVAWTINKKNVSGDVPEGAAAVYFKLNAEGKVRPIPEGKSDGMIIKITVTGDLDRSVYVNAESTVDLKTILGYTSDISFVLKEGECTIDGTSITLGDGDVTLEMTNPCTEHDFAYTQGDKEHTGVCSICNHQVIEDCKLINCTSNAIDWNAATHTGTCEKCGNVFSELCTYEHKKTDDGYKYVCACNRTEDAFGPMVAGDASDDGSLNLIDALRLLEKMASMEVKLNAHNADANGDSSVDMRDVSLVIRAWLGDSKAIDTCETVQNRVNVGNYYDLNSTTAQNLKMDGTLGTNMRYVVTDAIKVSEGNKVVFGPIRKTQAVLGHFYDKDGNAIELININNEKLETEYSFKSTVKEKKFQGTLEEKVIEGMVMASITAPEGAAYVRLQVNAKDKEQFYIRINNEFSLADYQYQTACDADTFTNKEKDQLFLVVGDSLCSAAVDTEWKGWRGRIARDFGVTMVNSSQGGAAVSTVSISGEIDNDLLVGETATDRQWIVSQLREHHNTQEFEYILLEGGGNDAHYDAPMGEISDSFDPATFDDVSTYAGAMELMIYEAIREHGDTVAIGFMSIYDGKYYVKSGKYPFDDIHEYCAVAKQICAKWGVSYLDLNTILTEEKFNSKPMTEGKTHYDPNGLTTDGIHANADGYDVMQEYIAPFVSGIVPEELKAEIPETMKPVSQEIYLKVQQYAQAQ